MSAVAEADASLDYLTGGGRPSQLSDAEYDDLQKWMVTEGLKNWVARTAAANEAIGRVVPFRPQLQSHLPFRPAVDNTATEDVLVELRKGTAL